ncbi:MAG: peptide chain release factor N(5)-glutamine methyltransferase [Nitrospinae bacterium]|nr:peptide chain release factor N(5)-glutamine methyltransferase [Nitrospinota bacterium]
MLLALCLGGERTALYRDPGYKLSSVELARFTQLVARRGMQEPLAYLAGAREFWSLPLAVQPGVLIPRPETEFVVEAALRYAPQCRHHGRRCRILDVGTGSGNIAIAIATSLAYASLVAIDIASAALTVAQTNAQTCGVADRMTYIQSDVLSALHPRRARFNLLLSNPPYIAGTEWASLPETVRRYEPRQALDGGPDGLLFYRRLIAGGPPYMYDDGFAIVEVGDRQAGHVCRLFEQSLQWRCVEVIKDYGGVERVVVAQCTRRGAESHGSHRN